MDASWDARRSLIVGGSKRGLTIESGLRCEELVPYKKTGRHTDRPVVIADAPISPDDALRDAHHHHVAPR